MFKVNLKSKLHLIDMGSLSPNKINRQQLGHLIMSVKNGQKNFVSSNDSKLAYLLRETMGTSAQNRITLIAHILNNYEYLNENMQIVQLSAKIHKSAQKLKHNYSKVYNYVIFV